MNAEVDVTQPSDAELDILHEWLRDAYWCRGVPRAIVERACANSICATARDGSGSLVGFARIVTDKATFAWLADVIVRPDHRRKGIGRELVRVLQHHPELSKWRRWLLATKDAHGVYEPLGFSLIADPRRLMQIRDPNPYGIPLE